MKIEQLPLDDTYGFHVFYGRDGEKFLPKLKTDEFFYNSENKWLPVACVCDVCQEAWRGASESIYRRKVAIPDDCELVGLDEVCGMCDYIQRNGERHAVTGPCWQSLTPRQILAKSKTFPHTSAVEPIAFIRRKKTEVKPEPVTKPQPVSNWISVKERLPENGNNVLLTNDPRDQFGCIDCLWTGFYCLDRWETKGRNTEPTHWLPLENILPPPPAPEKSLVEVEFEKWLKSYPNQFSEAGCKSSFLAALTLAKNKPELLKEVE